MQDCVKSLTRAAHHISKASLRGSGKRSNLSVGTNSGRGPPSTALRCLFVPIHALTHAFSIHDTSKKLASTLVPILPGWSGCKGLCVTTLEVTEVFQVFWGQERHAKTDFRFRSDVTGRETEAQAEGQQRGRIQVSPDFTNK